MRCPDGESGLYRETGDFHEIRSSKNKSGGPRNRKHGAIDATIDGCASVITATAYGKVSDIQRFKKEREIAPGKFIGSYGYMVELWHPEDNSYSKYAHMNADSLKVFKRGQIVHKGDIIGEEGSTGRSTGPHLHYELARGRKNDTVYSGGSGEVSRYPANLSIQIHPSMIDLLADEGFNKVLNATALYKPWLDPKTLKADVVLRGVSPQLLNDQMAAIAGYSSSDLAVATPEEQLYMLVDYYEKKFISYGFDLSFERPEEDYIIIRLPLEEARKLIKTRSGSEIVYGRKMTQNYSVMDIDKNNRIDLREAASYVRWAKQEVSKISVQKVDKKDK